MSRYENTYHGYSEQMLYLRGQLCKLYAATHTSYCGQKISSIIQSIDDTLFTAKLMRNVPSRELYSITCQMTDLYESNNGLAIPSSFNWKDCFQTLHRAAEWLKTITDDADINKVYRQLLTYDL